MLMNLRNLVLRIGVGLGIVIGMVGGASAQAPTLVASPDPVTTYNGYNAHLTVTVDSPGRVPSFQWYLNGVGALPGSFANVAGSTNATLAFTNLTLNNSGGYFAIISNPAGSVTSAPVNLIVLSPPLPALQFGELTPGGNGTVSLPVSYASGGTETNITFSVAYAPSAYSAPHFEPADAVPQLEPPTGVLFGQPSDAQLQVNNDPTGAVGISLSLDGGRVFAAGNQFLGYLVWNLLAEHQPAEGRIAFTNAPTPLQARSVTNGVVRELLTSQIPPVLSGRDYVPRLDRQSGLYLQLLSLANPGNSDLTNAQITVVFLPVDAHTNQVTAYNALGRLGANATVPVGTVPAGSSLHLTLEYFVPDHQGWPVDSAGQSLLPVLTTGGVLTFTRTTPPAIILNQNLVRITRPSDIPNAGFTGVLLDFPTLTNRSYYIQYSSLSDFTQTNQVRVVLPSVPGTGSTVQWVDNGPPKTESPPAAASARFYRVLEVR